MGNRVKSKVGNVKEHRVKPVSLGVVNGIGKYDETDVVVSCEYDICEGKGSDSEVVSVGMEKVDGYGVTGRL
jgi:hypothetical protein